MKTDQRLFDAGGARFRAMVAADGSVGGVEVYSDDVTSTGVARMWHDLSLLTAAWQILPRLSKHKRVYVPASAETLNSGGGKFCRTLLALSAQGVEVCVMLGLRPGVYEPQRLLQFVTATKHSTKIRLGVAIQARNWDAGGIVRTVGAKFVTVDQAEAMRLVGDRSVPLLEGTDVELVGVGLTSGSAASSLRRLGATWCSGPAARASRPDPAPRRGVGTAALTAVTIAVLAACASAPTPVVPDGSQRTPVNDPQRIKQLRAATSEQNVAVSERSALMGEVSMLRRQIDDLKTAVKVLLLAPPDTPATPPVSTAASAVPTSRAVKIAPSLPVDAPAPAMRQPQPQEAPPAEAAKRDARAIDHDDRGAIFRIFHGTGEAKFAPTGQFADELAAAAKKGQAIEIHGRTDSRRTTDANTRVAIARAVEARRWLIDQGVDAGRIRARYSSAGNFLVDADTDDAKALNRRVEVVIRADTAKTAVSKPMKQGA